MHHLAAKRGFGIVQSRRIDEHDLSALLRNDTLNAVSRRLWLGTDDGDLLTYNAIEERRFSRVGAAENGDEASASAVLLRLDPVVWLRQG